MNKKICLAWSFLLVLSSSVLFGQSNVFVGDTAGSDDYSYGPIYRSSSASSFNYSFYGYIFPATDLALPVGTTINSISWKKQTANTITGGVSHFTIRMKNSFMGSFGTTERYDSLTSPTYTVVYSSTSQNITGAADTWETFTFPAPFTYNGGNLIVSVDWDRNGGTSNGALDWYYETASGLGVGYASGSAPTASSTTSSSYTGRRPAVRLNVSYPAGACFPPSSLTATATGPTDGTASWTSGGAANSLVEYGPAGFVLGSGTQLYVSGTTVNLAGLSPNTAYDVYVKDSCASNSSPFIGPSSFTTPCANALNGTYTINSSSPTGGTNFNSFADLAAELNTCGVSGPVTINVTEGTYTEQIMLDSIHGVNASNPVVIQASAANSNPAVITYSASGTSDNFLIGFNNTHFVTVAGLTLNPTGSSHTRAFTFEGSGSNLVLDNNTITAATSSSTSTNYALIYNYSGTSNNYDDVTIKNNTITGGSYGMYWYGGSTTAHETNNQIDSNTVTDFYYYGIYAYHQDNLSINGNEITQSLSAPYSTGYGIYNNNCDNTEIIGNTIVVYGTSTNYGIYSTNSEGSLGSPMLFANNMISTLNNSGTTYGIYPYNCYYLDIVYNSINITAGSATAGRGIYLNSSTSGTYGNINLYNNNVVNTGGGYAAEISSGATTLGYVTASDYNNMYASGATLTRINNSNQATLADHQTATGMDANSVSVDPLFASPTDLHVVNPALDGAAMTYAAITIDIDGDPRTGPDIGADEFTPPSCLPSSSLMVVNVYADSVRLAWSAGDGATFNLEYGTTGYTQGSGTLISGINDTTLLITGLTPQTGYDFYVQDDCGGSTSPWSGPGSFTTDCAPFPAPYLETFTGTSTPNCWIQYAQTGGPWVFTGTPDFGSTYAMPDHTTGSLNNYAWVDQSGTDIGVVLEAPWVDVSALTNPMLSYWIVSHNNNNSVSVFNILYAEAWTPAGWVSIDSVQGDFGLQWVEFTVNLAPYVQNDLVKVRFRQESGGDGNDYDNDMLLDDVGIIEAPSCPAPSNAGVTAITDVSADLYWTSGGASDWNVEYGTAGFTPGTGTMINATNDTVSITGLTAATTYEFYVRDSCAVGDVSAWVGPTGFTTGACNPAATCTFTADLTDSYGDGWNGNVLGIMQNGVIVSNFGASFTSGSNFGPVNLQLCDGITAYVVVTSSGSFSDEVGFSITDPFSVGVVTYPDGVSFGLGDTLANFTPSCTPPACIPPSILGVTNLTSTSVDFYFTGGGAADFNIEYGVSGFTLGTGTQINATNDTVAITGLSAVTAYDIYVRDSCAIGNVSPWAGPASFTTPIQGPVGVTCTSGNAAIIFSEEFDGSTSFTGDISSSNGDWNFDNNTTSSGSTGPLGPQSGSHYIYFEASGAGPASMISPVIDLTAALSDAELSFWLHAYGSDVGYLHVTASNSPSGPFTDTLFTLNGELQTSSSDPWQQVGIDVSSYLGQSLYLNFTADRASSFRGDIAIDLLQVQSCLTCPAPSALGATNIATTGADIFWTTGGASNWDVEYGPAGFVLGSGTMVSATNDTLSLSGLSLGTDYEFYVRDSCGLGDLSPWVGPFGFNTLCGVFTAPYLQTFTGTSTPNCWTQSATTGGPWVFTGTPDFGSNYAMPDHTTGSLNNYAWVDQSGTDVGVILEAPEVDVSSLTTPWLSYWVVSHNNNNSVSVYNILYAEAWDGTNWIAIDSVQGDFGLQWVEFTVDLTTYTYSTNLVKVRFRQESGGDPNDYDNDMLLDDVAIMEAPTCFMPTSLGGITASSTSADISWTTGGASNWNVEYGPAGFTPGTGTMINVTSTPYTVTGLSTNLAYEFYVRDSCAVGDVSTWAGPYTFGAMESCDNFDGYAAGVIDPQSILINGWAGAGGDAEVSTDFASSSPYSLKIYDSGPSTFSDVVAEVGTYTSGAWNVAMDVYVPSGHGGYYNILHSYTGGSNVWAIEVTLDSNGVATVDEGTNGTGSIGTYNYNMGAWNTIEHVIDLDNDTAYLRVNGVTTNLGWQFSLGSTNLADQFNAVNFYSTAPTGHTPLIYFDNFCITPEAVSGAGCTPFTSTIPNDTICAPGLTGFTSPAGSVIVYRDPTTGLVRHAGDTLRIMTMNDTTLNLQEAVRTSNTGRVGPLTNLTGGFGNFSNGQWISVLDTIRIDSMTVRANGVVQAHARIFTNDPALGGTLVQTGKTFTTGSAAGDYQVEVGVVLTPGTYFMNINFIGGSGQLFRSTGGATYPYVLSGLMSIDSTNFSNQTRIYYTFDMVVTKMCLGNPVSVTSYIEGLSAGSDATLALCDNGSAEDLTAYLSADADLGGTFVSTTASGAITGNLLDPSLLSVGSYQVHYTTVATLECPADSALFTINVQACTSCVGLTAPSLTGDTICGPGTVNISGATSATDIIWYDDMNGFLNYGLSVSASITASTYFKAQAVQSAGPTITVGPSPSTFSNPYPTGNFTNGQWITAYQDLRIDSATFAVNGPLNFRVAIQDAGKTDTLQVSNLISFAGADTAQREVGIVLTPGTYFISVIPVSGTGIMYRPTGGGNFPYGVSNLLTADSSDFGPTRYYYLYEMIVSGACISPMDSVQGIVNPASLTAGTDSVATVCETETAVDLSNYLVGADPGGSWVDLSGSGAFTGTIFNASAVTAGGSYAFAYFLSPAGCPNDSAIITVNVEALPNAGTDGRDTICDTAAVVDLNLYLSAGADAGGTWLDASSSGALTGSMFDPAQASSPGSYTFWYVSAGLVCDPDTASFDIFVDTCTIGLDKYTTGAFILYPNPTVERVYIENSYSNSRHMMVEIHALNGQLIYRAVFEGNEKAEIDMSAYADGVYSVKVITDDVTEVFRLVKQ